MFKLVWKKKNARKKNIMRTHLTANVKISLIEYFKNAKKKPFLRIFSKK